MTIVEQDRWSAGHDITNLHPTGEAMPHYEAGKPQPDKIT